MTDQQLSKETVVKQLRNADWVMLTSTGADGKLVSHPMTPQEVTDDADVLFLFSTAVSQAEALRKSNHVNIAVSETGSWLSVAATVEFVDDQAKIDELWNEDMEAYFDGRNDPNLGLLRANAESAQSWGLSGGKIENLFEMAKSRVTGDKPDGGTGTAEL